MSGTRITRVWLWLAGAGLACAVAAWMKRGDASADLGHQGRLSVTDVIRAIEEEFEWGSGEGWAGLYALHDNGYVSEVDLCASDLTGQRWHMVRNSGIGSVGEWHAWPASSGSAAKLKVREGMIPVRTLGVRAQLSDFRFLRMGAAVSEGRQLEVRYFVAELTVSARSQVYLIGLCDELGPANLFSIDGGFRLRWTGERVEELASLPGEYSTQWAAVLDDGRCQACHDDLRSGEIRVADFHSIEGKRMVLDEVVHHFSRDGWSACWATVLHKNRRDPSAYVAVSFGDQQLRFDAYRPLVFRPIQPGAKIWGGSRGRQGGAVSSEVFMWFSPRAFSAAVAGNGSGEPDG